MTLHIAQLSTPVGWFRAEVTDGAVRTATFAGEASDEHDPFGVRDALDDYFAGDPFALDRVPVSPRGTEFQMRVWAALRTIPAGSTCSYRDLAVRVGVPLASRAVGRANATNPVPLFVPCHRVVRADGQLGGFAFGLECKRWLIDHDSRSNAIAVTNP